MNMLEEADEIVLSGIAQYLSDLSQDAPLPIGVGPKMDIAPFSADDVSFANNDWLTRTIAVQAWLGLDRQISATSAPKESAEQLLEDVSPDAPEYCLAINENQVVRLTALGAQHLETWLSRAVSNREAFVEALDENEGLKEASDNWSLLWEEAGALARQPALIKAEVRTLTVKQLSDYARDDKLDLNPSYQRDSVWSTSDSQFLIESILRGIPIPSLILTTVEGEERLQIVDGKQRLTAILRFIGQHPSARAFARTLGAEAEFDADHKKFMRKHHLKSQDISQNYLPFRLKLYKNSDPLHVVSGRFYSEVKDVKIDSGQGSVTVKQIFDNTLSKYQIPVIVYENTRLQDIHQVFSIYNKQGKKLNAEELRNATYHHLAITRLLLVLSGDRLEVDELAPYLPAEVRGGISEVGEALRDRGFGTMRFKRTKVLSWVCALMLHGPNRGRDGTFVTPSTASHIDSLLTSIGDRPGSHALYQNATLVDLARDIRAAVMLHVSVDDAWAPRFRSKKSYASRWEELPLVASLVATLILVAIGRSQSIIDGFVKVREVTQSSPGPTKTQNKTQWEYIADVVMRVLGALDIDLQEAADLLNKRYSHSCIEVFQSLSKPVEA